MASDGTIKSGQKLWQPHPDDAEDVRAAMESADRVKLAAELLASVAPGEVVSGTDWEHAWLSEVEERETLEPDGSLGPEHELPAVRRRLLGLFR